jgi:hypothetical protein
MRSVETLERTMSEIEVFFNSPEVKAMQRKALDLGVELESYNMGKTSWDRTYGTKQPSKALRDSAKDAREKLFGFVWQGCLSDDEE